MPFRIAALIVTFLLAATSVPCLGQRIEDGVDTALSREQWLQRVEDARRRSEEFVANARAHSLPPLAPEEKEQEAADRAINDPTLQQGDIVSTAKGFVVFVGRDEEHKPSDFQAAPNPEPPR